MNHCVLEITNRVVNEINQSIKRQRFVSLTPVISLSPIFR